MEPILQGFRKRIRDLALLALTVDQERTGRLSCRRKSCGEKVKSQANSQASCCSEAQLELYTQHPSSGCLHLLCLSCFVRCCVLFSLQSRRGTLARQAAELQPESNEAHMLCLLNLLHDVACGLKLLKHHNVVHADLVRMLLGLQSTCCCFSVR
jgi:hypothetical protein